MGVAFLKWTAVNFVEEREGKLSPEMKQLRDKAQAELIVNAIPVAAVVIRDFIGWLSSPPPPRRFVVYSKFALPLSSFVPQRIKKPDDL
jgi:hypothetical protein